jgi:hypothetical protein
MVGEGAGSGERGARVSGRRRGGTSARWPWEGNGGGCGNGRAGDGAGKVEPVGARVALPAVTGSIARLAVRGR